MSFLKKIIVFSFLSFSFTSNGLAEIIQLKSGQIIEGKVLSQDQNSIIIDTGKRHRVSYPLAQIKEIYSDSSKQFKEQIIAKQKANELENQAIESIDNNKMAEGLILMKRALEVDATPMRHMNLGSILFGNGVADFKEGKKAQAKETLRQSEEQLMRAIAGFDPRTEKIFLAQAYLLLGEIYSNAFLDKEKAKDFYKESLSYYENQAAKTALELL